MEISRQKRTEPRKEKEKQKPTEPNRIVTETDRNGQNGTDMDGCRQIRTDTDRNRQKQTEPYLDCLPISRPRPV